MKNIKIIFIWCSLILCSQFSQAQVVDKIKRFEVSGGLNNTNGHLRVSFSTGYWLTPHLKTEVFVLSPQRRTILFEPYSLRLEGGRMEKASIALGSTSGLNFRGYLKPQNGLFFGLGLSRQHYLVTAKSVFDNNGLGVSSGDLLFDILLGAVTGGDYVAKVETTNAAWGINWQFGVAIPVKKARLEFLIRQNHLMLKNQKYSYQTTWSQNSPSKDRVVQSDFSMPTFGLELSYFLLLF